MLVENFIHGYFPTVEKLFILWHATIVRIENIERRVSNTATSLATVITNSTTGSPGPQPNVQFTTNSTSLTTVQLYTFNSTGTWTVKGQIKGDNATRSFAREFSFIARQQGGNVVVGPMILGPLDGDSDPTPSFAGTITNSASYNSVRIDFTSGDSDQTTWTISYGVF